MWKLIGLGRCGLTPVLWDIMIIANMVQSFFYFKPLDSLPNAPLVHCKKSKIKESNF